MSDKKSLKYILERVKLSNLKEQRLIDAAITSLNNDGYEPKVIKELKLVFENFIICSFLFVS